MHGLARMLAALAVGGLAAAASADDEPEAAEPGLEFLEYLGGWQEQDEEWWLPAVWAGAIGGDDAPREQEPEPDGEEPDEAGAE